MKIAVSGTNGSIGKALVPLLISRGHTIVPIRRSQSLLSDNSIVWDVQNNRIDPRQMEGIDAVIHLAGENIGDSRWTSEKKRRIYDSRINGTRAIVDAIIQSHQPPKVLLCASGIGFYGDCGDKVVQEGTPNGEGFLAGVCNDWEREAFKAVNTGVRVCSLRFAIALSREEGALKQLLPLFRWGIGGRLGSGKQWMSWIAMTDLVEAIGFCLQNDSISGAVNVTSPNPVTNSEFTNTLAKLLHRPAFFPVPEFVLKIVLGEFSESVLGSTRAIPKVLLDNDFPFRYPELSSFLQSFITNP